MIRATLVSTAACHLCERARDVLGKVSGGDMELTELDWDSPAGQALVRRDGIPFPPAVFIEGQFAAYGRVSEGAIRKRVQALR